MSGRIVNIETSAHQAIQELLPWFVMDRLEGDELEVVREHLAGCPQCRAEVEWQRRLCAANVATQSTVAKTDIDAGWARMQAMLDLPAASAAEGRAQAVPERMRRRSAANGSWMSWALAAQFVLIVGLGVMVAHLKGESAAYRESFHALGTPRSVSGNLMVMFRPQTAERDLREVLQASGARMVDGPTSTGAYLLHVDDEKLAAAVAALRARDVVTLAEPLTRGAAQ